MYCNPQIQDNAITKTKFDDLFIDLVVDGWLICKQNDFIDASEES